MSIITFQQQLEAHLKKSVKLTINDNRSTMLSVKWEPNCTKISMHRFFLKAPENIMDALACYIKRENESIAPSVKSFMEEELRRYDYSHELDKSRLIVQGDIYNLKEMMGEINREYFSNDLTLQITWFGKKYQHNRSQVTFGLYHEPLKLIKINRFLDNKKVPDYLVNYVIYHEMLHHVCPSYYDEDGRHKIHNKEFKKRETDFRFFSKAQDWIKKNKERLFRGI